MGRSAFRVRLATIDLGTNTVRLLAVDGDGGCPWRVIDQDQRVTRLGEGLAASGRLGRAAMERTAAAVVEYAARAVRAGCRDVRIVATSAVREAANGPAFAADVARRAGWPVRVIGGEEEARLTVRGVLAALGGGGGALIAFDIGGGSTEYVRARDGAVVAAASLRLGVVRLAERHPCPGAMSGAAWGALVAEVGAALEAGLPRAVVDGGAARLVGTAGTVTALAALDLGLAAYDAARVQGHVLERRAIEELRRRLAALDHAGRAALPCLEPGRADLILPGVAIVLATMDLLDAARLTVSDWGLREGLVAEALGEQA